MRLILLPILLAGCTLITDFDREYPRVVLELAGPVPPPASSLGLGPRLEICTAGCTLLQQCSYAASDEPCAHGVGQSFEKTNADFYLSTCVGTCLTADQAVGLRGLRTCEDIAALPELEAFGEAIFCQGDVSVCGEAFLCSPLPRPLPALFEACIDIDLGTGCVDACESLPQPFWACVAQDTFFELERWKKDLEDLGTPPGDAELEARLVRILCERLARCAGAPTPAIFGADEDGEGVTPGQP